MSIQRSILVGMVFGFILSICCLASVFWIIDKMKFEPKVAIESVDPAPKTEPIGYNTEFICYNVDNAKIIQSHAGLSLNLLNLVTDIRIEQDPEGKSFIVFYKNKGFAKTEMVQDATQESKVFVDLNWKEYYGLSEPINQFILEKIVEYDAKTENIKRFRSDYDGLSDETQVFFDSDTILEHIISGGFLGINQRSLFFIIGATCYDSYFVIYKSTNSPEFRNFALSRTGGFLPALGYGEHIEEIDLSFLAKNIVWKEEYRPVTRDGKTQIELITASQMSGVTQDNNIIWKDAN